MIQSKLPEVVIGIANTIVKIFPNLLGFHHFHRIIKTKEWKKTFIISILIGIII